MPDESESTPVANEIKRPHGALLFPEDFLDRADVDHGVKGLMDWLDNNLHKIVAAETKDTEWAKIAGKALWLYADRIALSWEVNDSPYHRSSTPQWRKGMRDGMHEILVSAMGLEREVENIDYLFARADSTPGHVISPDPKPQLKFPR
jgi:hypothetical protein